MIDLTKPVRRNQRLMLTIGDVTGPVTYVKKAGFARSSMLYVRTAKGAVLYVHQSQVTPIDDKAVKP